jgi:hypothetical protein
MHKIAIAVLNAVAISAYVDLAQGQTTVVRPVETQEILVNPGMGIKTFQRYNGDSLNAGVTWSEEGPVSRLTVPRDAPDFPRSTVAYCRWHWATLEPEQGKIHWEIIDLALAEAKRHGQRLMIRLMPYPSGTESRVRGARIRIHQRTETFGSLTSAIHYISRIGAP